MSNAWNVKDVFTINPVGAKSGKGCAISDYSNLPDSQFLFGSQTSQSFSQEIRGSQQASQEITETKASTSYHNKPVLFVDGKVANMSGGRAMGILDRFEEEKRKAKEIEILLGVRQLHESLENVKNTFLNCIDGSCDITRASVAEGMDTFRKTFQDNFATIKDSITSQTELLMSQTCRKIKDNEEKTSLALKDLSSLVLSIRQDLESLKLEQSKEQSLLGEILSLLGSIMTAYSTGAHRVPVQMIDNTVQTSPGFVAQFCAASEKKCYYEDMKQCIEACNYSVENADQRICPPEKLRGASFQVRGTRPFVNQQQHIGTERSEPNGWKKSYRLHAVTTNSTSQVATSIGSALVQDPMNDYMVRNPVHIEPVKSLNYMNRNNSASWIEEPKNVPKRAQKCQNFRKKKRALILPQRRPYQAMALNNVFEDSQHGEDQENRVPQSAVSAYERTSKALSGTCLPLQQQSTTTLANTNEFGQHLEDSWSWSQSSNSSQVIVEYQQAEWETVKPEQKAKTLQSVTWQVFDFISDSD